jgi:CDP-diacylglycerol--glycerol-3-phosphate 3-phosphatidyltransferase
MPQINHPSEKEAARRLRREWAAFVLLAVGFVAGGYVVLQEGWGEESTLRWAAAVVLVLGYLFGSLWRHLHENRLNNKYSAPLMGSLGPANIITITRAVFTAGLAGFLFGPIPTGWLAWAPGMLFLTISLMDTVDGAVARISRRPTILGARLDMQWDSVGLLAASLLAVLYGQVPLVYMVMGLARYIYLFALELHRRQGGEVRPLPPSRYRRGLGALHMGFVAVILLPLFAPPWTRIVALLIMAPSLVGFVHDYLSVTGKLHHGTAEDYQISARLHLVDWLPLALRIGLVALLLSMMLPGLKQTPPAIGILLVAGLAIPLVLLGVSGRAASLAVLFMSGFAAREGWAGWLIWAVMVLSLLLFLIGTGKYSLWKPEEWLIDHQVGEGHG